MSENWRLKCVHRALQLPMDKIDSKKTSNYAENKIRSLENENTILRRLCKELKTIILRMRETKKVDKDQMRLLKEENGRLWKAVSDEIILYYNY
jgi:hypothetical protein